jgi:hypothetical protein
VKLILSHPASRCCRLVHDRFRLKRESCTKLLIETDSRSRFDRSCDQPQTIGLQCLARPPLVLLFSNTRRLAVPRGCPTWAPRTVSRSKPDRLHRRLGTPITRRRPALRPSRSAPGGYERSYVWACRTGRQEAGRRRPADATARRRLFSELTPSPQMTKAPPGSEQNLSALKAACVRLVAPILRMMLRIWTLAVLSLMPSSWAMILLALPC